MNRTRLTLFSKASVKNAAGKSSCINPCNRDDPVVSDSIEELVVRDLGSCGQGKQTQSSISLLVRLDGQSRDPPECAVSGDEPLTVPLADRRDEQVRRGHLLAPFDEEGTQASSLCVRFSVEVQEDEGIQELLRPLQAAAPLQMSSDEDLRRRGRGDAPRPRRRRSSSELIKSFH